jgi:biopolymer transport protein ExbB
MYSSQKNSRPIRFVQAMRWILLTCISVLFTSTASAWWSSDWSFRKPLVVDTSAIKTQGDLANVPVLIRLHEGVFSFKDAKPEGADLRFVAEDDKTPLKYHIEKYDTAANLAFIWVSVPKVKVSGKTGIWMYYGNSKAAKADTPAASYDGNQTLLYHFNEHATPVSDITSYANNSTSTVTTDSGLIGNSAQFTGKNVVVLPASPSLATTPESALTWSAWIKPSVAGSTAVIYSRREGNQAFVIGLNQGTPYLMISNKTAANQMTVGASAITGSDWHHLAVVAEPNKINLLVDGNVVSTLTTTLPTLSGIAVLGADAPAGATVEQASNHAQTGFVGSLDELSISKQSRGASFAQVEALNQGTASTLIVYGVDEQTSTWRNGFLGIILGALTTDGWVIIGILAIIGVLSWIVIVRKSALVSHVLRANAAFQALFGKVNGDFALLESIIKNIPSSYDTQDKSVHISESERALIKDAPLYHLFHVGEKELATRTVSDDAQHQSHLTAQSIEAIRATLESHLVRENQLLNKNLVLLTIAISGGPFLGLLGTVVGVMITFAAIASSGDVNINAIAPGVAGALAATVAGLLVAIPALFGYNFLITRIKDAVAQMHIFLNVFVTRMAENYATPNKLLPKKGGD